jgi:hypothetical protein
MQAAHIAPELPGTSASGAAKGTARLIGALVVVGFVPLTLLEIIGSGEQGGHLPWPMLQWVVTTPPGVLLLTALCLLMVGPPFILYSMWQLRQQVAQAIDITYWPPIAWPIPWSTRPQPPSIQRWFGYGRREQVLSLIMLVLGTLLAIELVGIFIASSLYGLYERGRLPCRTTGTGCSPDFPFIGILLVALWAVVALSCIAQFRWLRRVEATSHVWLRYRDWSWPSPLCYVRQPGVTPEAVAAALAPFSPALAVPFARRFLINALAITPLVLLVSASFVLSAWLQLLWIPG